MTTGTKIFLAVFALVVGILVVYYGLIVPDGGPAQASASSQREQGSDVAAESQERNALPAKPERDASRAALPPRKPAPSISPTTSFPPTSASTAGGLLSEGVREAAGESTAPPIGSASNRPNPFLPLIGLNGGESSDAGARDAAPPANAVAPAASSEPQRSTQSSQPQANAPAQLPAAPARGTSTPPQRIEYIIKSGDTFTTIADDWFGDEHKWSLIAKANPTVDPQRLKIGQKIYLPPKELGAQASAPDPAMVEGQLIYVVQSGDTLSSIARELYDDSGRWEEIYRLNRDIIGVDPGALKVGMKLKVPAKRSW